MRQILILTAMISLVSCRSTTTQVKNNEPVEERNTEQKERNISKNTNTDKTPAPADNKVTNKAKKEKFDEIGYSSWYGEQFQGKKTASGELFDRNKLTAAHRTLPFGSMVKVHNLANHLETTVRINDRGPYSQERLIDVSEKAAELLKFKQIGRAKVGISLVKAVQVKGDDLEEGLDDFLEDDLGGDEEFLKEIESEDEKPATTIPSEDEKQPLPAGSETESQPAPKADSNEKLDNTKPKGYTVQLGYFMRRSNADKFKPLAKTFQQKVFIYTRGKAYVVQIGQFSDRKAALKLQKQLKAKGIPSFVPKQPY